MPSKQIGSFEFHDFMKSDLDFTLEIFIALNRDGRFSGFP
jgi:hypothetical protein